jgi:hypothetical protein
LRPRTTIIAIATAISVAVCHASSTGLTATAAIAGPNTSVTKTTNRGNCGARIGTLATEKV